MIKSAYLAVLALWSTTVHLQKIVLKKNFSWKNSFFGPAGGLYMGKSAYLAILAPWSSMVHLQKKKIFWKIFAKKFYLQTRKGSVYR